MSWHNGRTHQQILYLEQPLDRRTAVGIGQRPLDREIVVVTVCTGAGLKHDRWKVCMTVMPMQGRVEVYTSRYMDARITADR